MRLFFDREMTPDDGHTGRWRRDVAEANQVRIDRDYTRLCDELRSKGVTLPE